MSLAAFHSFAFDKRTTFPLAHPWAKALAFASQPVRLSSKRFERTRNWLPRLGFMLVLASGGIYVAPLASPRGEKRRAPFISSTFLNGGPAYCPYEAPLQADTEA
jgi:hypothetical protein